MSNLDSELGVAICNVSLPELKRKYKEGQKKIRGPNFDKDLPVWQKILDTFIIFLQLFWENGKCNFEDENSIKYLIENIYIEWEDSEISTKLI